MWHISRLEILEERFVKSCQRAILIICCQNGYKTFGVVYLSLACFEAQRHVLVKCVDKNVRSYHLGVFEQRSHLLGGFKSYCVDIDEDFPC